MRKIAVVGSGQAGLLAAHALVQRGYDVALYSDRTPESWLRDARPTGTAVRFARSLAFERRLGLCQGHAEAPRMDGLQVTICSHAARPLLGLRARFAVSPLAIDLRLQSAAWLTELERAGGRVRIERVSPERIDEIARDHDLTIVATGKEGGALFERDAARSPHTAPLRRLAMVNCEGPALQFADVAFAAAKFNVLDGVGECYWTPYFHKDGRPVWNLVFEARPGSAHDRFGGARSGDEVLAIAKQLVREALPWDFGWLEHATLADEHSWLVGAVTPTVRQPIGRVPSGRPVVPLGDAYAAFDPLGAQGANMGNRLAEALTTAIIARGDQPFDAAWITSVYEPFYERWAGPAMRWTHLLLEPMRLAARYLVLAQDGADGSTVGGTPRQRIADAFGATFDDPSTLVDTLGDLRRTRRRVAELAGGTADWRVAGRLLAVGARQLRNTLRA